MSTPFFTGTVNCIAAFFILLGIVFVAPSLSFSQINNKEKEIQVALEKGAHFLSSIQRQDGAICDTINPLFDTWETVLSATALYNIYGDTNNISLKKSITYLRLHENDDGLICHNKKCKQAYCLETTAVYFLLLFKIGEAEKVNQRIKIILDLQKPTGEWLIGNPDVREHKDFPSVTGFILNLLQTLHAEPIYSKEAYQWIIDKQKPEGDWGATWEYYDCPAYALSAILSAFKKQHTPAIDAAIQKAIAYISSQQNIDGSWEFKNVSDKRPSKELQTGLMLSALECMDYGKKEEPINKAIDFLLARQQVNGSWDGGYFPIDSKSYVKKEYVFATAQAMMVLQKYLKYQQDSK